MAAHGKIGSDALAKKWFVIAFFGALTYLTIVYVFVYTVDVGPNQYATEAAQGD